jgi:hypothetical protein
MSNNIFDSFKKVFKGKDKKEKKEQDGTHRINVSIMEKRYEEDDLVEAAYILQNLLEIYGTQKRKNHRLKGREFIHFILSSKHKDLKNVGYTHWQNINKIIHLNQEKPYPYHKQNLRKAMDFFEKELKSINAIDMVI